MKKKLSLFISIILLLSLILFGCSKSSKDELMEALVKSSEIKSQETSMELDFDMGLDEEEVIVFDDSSIKVESKADIEKQKSITKMKFSLMGMALEGETLIDGDMAALSFPFLTNLLGIGDKYLIGDIEEILDEDSGFPLSGINDMSLDKELNKVLAETLDSSLKEEQITVEKDVEVETPEETIKGTKYEVKLSGEETKDLVEDFMIKALKNESLQDSVLLFLKSGESEIKNNIGEEEIKENPEEEVKELLENRRFEGDIKVDFVIDSNNYVRRSNALLNLNIIDEETEERQDISFDISQKMWNINKDIEIDIPEF